LFSDFSRFAKFVELRDRVGRKFVPVHRELHRVVREHQRVDELALGELAGRLRPLQSVAGRLVELGDLGAVVLDRRLGLFDLRLHLADVLLGRSAAFRNFVAHVALRRASRETESA
jgi:hypothetical protein